MNQTIRQFTAKKPIDSRFYNRFLNTVLTVGVTIAISVASPLYGTENKITQIDQSSKLTLFEAIQRTFEHHPDLQSFQHQIKAQQGRVIQANLSPKPEVELTLEDAFGSGNFGGVDSAQTTLSVSWVLDQSLREKRSELASRGTRLIESERAIKQLDTAAQTARYFLISLSFQERQVIAKRSIALAETTVIEIKQRVKVGKTPLAERYRAEAELAKRRLILVDLEHELEASLHQLAAQWGSTSPRFDSVSGALLTQPKVISFQALKKQISHNPELARYLSLERVKQAELNLAKQQREPLWKFTTGVRRYERTDDFAIVAGISIPFGGSNRNQGRIAEVSAKLSQNKSEADALRIRIETSVFVVYQQLEHSFHLSDMLVHEIIPRLEKALNETHQAYELGKYSYLDWLAVQNELLDAQSALLEASLSAHINKIELERLTGTQITSPF